MFKIFKERGAARMSGEAAKIISQKPFGKFAARALFVRS
jgi:hypothetical protein